MSDVSGQGATGCGRLDELHVEIAEPDKGTKIRLEACEGTDDRFQQVVLPTVGPGPERDKRGRGDVRRLEPSRLIVQAPGTEGCQDRLEDDGLLIQQLRHRSCMFRVHHPKAGVCGIDWAANV